MKRPLLLSYAACGTCKKARKWLSERGIEVDVRAIVEDPPRPAELDVWLPASGLPARKWLNTSGASYRELGGKATFDGASDERIAAMLAGDGKLVKRPVLVDGVVVLVGFSEAAYAAHFEPPATLRSGKAPPAPAPPAASTKTNAKTNANTNAKTNAKANAKTNAKKASASTEAAKAPPKQASKRAP